MSILTERKGKTSVAWIKGRSQQLYEDRFRMLSKDVPLVSNQNRGELFAVFDGIGSASEGRHAAQHMADQLIDFYRETFRYSADQHGLCQLLMDSNNDIYHWGLKPGTQTPVGGCAGTVVWIYEKMLYVFHAGDTVGLHIREYDGQDFRLTGEHQMPDGSIFQFFGMGEKLQIETVQTNIDESDRILIMSDGVTKVFHPRQIAEIIDKIYDSRLATMEIIHQCLLRGASDDMTVMLIEIDDLADEHYCL